MSFLQRVGVFFCVLWTGVCVFGAESHYGHLTFDVLVLNTAILAVIGNLVIFGFFCLVDWIFFPHHYRFGEPSPEEESPHTIDLN